MAEFKFDYKPREQFLPLHQRTQRWAAMVCHRRAGKTVACIRELILRAMYTNKKNARYAYLGPYYRQVKDIAWQYLKEFADGIAVEVRESDLRVILPQGQWITLYGADNPDAIRGIYLDGVILDEYGDCRPSLWGTVIRPTLSDRKGWAIFIGTFKGKNHFYNIIQRAERKDNWYHLMLKASESGIIDDEELLELKEDLTEAEYQQEYECNPNAAVLGTYFAGMIQKLEAQGQIANFPDLYDPFEPVFASMDLGRKDSTAIWWWQEHDDNYINIIDYAECDGMIIEDMLDIFYNRPYTLEILWVPHDARAHTVQTRRSSVEQFLDAGFNAQLVPSLKRQQGIDAARLMLPQCRIDMTKCSEGVEALRAYRRQFNELTKAFHETPLHNWASDGADSFRYLSLVAKQKQAKLPVKEPVDINAPPKVTLNDLFEDRERGVILSIAKRRIH